MEISYGILSSNIVDENICKELKFGEIKYNFKFLKSEGVYLSSGVPNIEYGYAKLERFLNLMILFCGEIYNKEHIRDILNIDSSEKISDMKLIGLLYQKYEEECVLHIDGEFTIVVFDCEKSKIYVARDVIGKQLLYYYWDGKNFVFSTLMKPILEYLKYNVNINIKWINRTLLVPGASQDFDLISTPYVELSQLQPAHSITIESGKFEIRKYWDIKKIKRKSKKEKNYSSMLKNTLQKSVDKRVQNQEKIAVSLSGGLDSTAVCSCARKSIYNKCGITYGYHSVPLPKYNQEPEKGWTNNEVPAIKKISDRYSDVSLNVIDSSNLNAYESIPYLLSIIEQPYNYMRNLYWMHDICHKAKENGCSVMLDGQSGNFTISFGDITSYIVTSLMKLRILKVIKGIKSFSRFRKVSQKKVYRYFLSAFKNDVLYYFNSLFKRSFEKKLLKDIVIISDPENIDWKDIISCIKRYNLGTYGRKLFSIKFNDKFINDCYVISHAAVPELKISLATGIYKTDPTRDKEILELYYKIPIDSWFGNGIERKLIRDAFRDELPKSIIENHLLYGSQAPDWIYRIEEFKENIILDLKSIQKNVEVSKFFNIDSVQNFIFELGKCAKMNDLDCVDSIFRVIIVYRFLEGFYKNKNQYNT